MAKINRPGVEYARNLLEASFDPLFVIDAEGKVMDVNDATLNATEKTREKIIGTDFFTYFTEDRSNLYNTAIIIKNHFLGYLFK